RRFVQQLGRDGRRNILRSALAGIHRVLVSCIRIPSLQRRYRGTLWNSCDLGGRQPSSKRRAESRPLAGRIADLRSMPCSLTDRQLQTIYHRFGFPPSPARPEKYVEPSPHDILRLMRLLLIAVTLIFATSPIDASDFSVHDLVFLTQD